MNALRTVARRDTPTSLFARSFHATAPSLESTKQRRARLKRQKNLAKRAENISAEDANRPHPVLGQAGGVSNEAAKEKWESTKLYKTMVDPNYLGLNKPFTPKSASEVKYIPSQGVPKDIEPKEPPEYLNFGLSKETASALLNDLPKQTVDLEDAFKPSRVSSLFPEAYQTKSQHNPYDLSQPLSDKDAALKSSVGQREAMERIVDLRNASAQGLAYANRQRIIQAFSRAPTGTDEEQKVAVERPDTGSPEVQAALMTAKIRNLWDHLTRNSRDIHNRRALRTLVHQRAKVLRYLKRKDTNRYETLLPQLGLEKGSVEGEIIVR
ncbi:hypothetical protein FRC04_010243 [Tulasnella sp. 424]|nr:hypothetical protein FRC04_010243 [Tulasnella sp. 424]KAG8972093.1 hypothetical protein FRC05_010385 [Tulasnella sp. 425]